MYMQHMQKRMGNKQEKKNSKKRICLPRVHISGTKKATEIALNLFFSFNVAKAVATKIVEYTYIQRGGFAIGSEYLFIAFVFIATYLSVKTLLQAVDMKESIEKKLGFKVSNSDYKRAEERAINKQRRIFKSTNNDEVLKASYLKQLIYEAIREQKFEQCSISVCELVANMKKEHPAHSKGTHQHSYCNSSLQINQSENLQ